MSVQAPENAPVSTPETPHARWVVWLCCAVVGLAVATAIAMIMAGKEAPSAGVTAVQLDVATFSPAAVEVPLGSVLEFVDLDDGEPHFLANGQWAGMTITPATDQPGAPVLDELEVDGGTVTVGPFTEAGVFPIYCSIHPGMNIEVKVT